MADPAQAIVPNSVQTIRRLTVEDYQAVERAIPGAVTIVTSSTTELQAGYQLGVQAALKVLRDGFTSGL